MQYIKTPMKGMPEQLPADMQLREYLLGKIKATYGSYGFSLIETPAIEHIENLTSKQGGDNEKLIFKILKRGEKLAKADGADELCDCGLRCRSAMSGAPTGRSADGSASSHSATSISSERALSSRKSS